MKRALAMIDESFVERRVWYTCAWLYTTKERAHSMTSSFIPQECKVALLAGGTSGEREISLKSAQGASKALKEAGFQVTQLDPADENDLKKVTKNNFDVAFLCVHGKDGEDGILQAFLDSAGIPYTGSGVQASAIAANKDAAKQVYKRSGIITPQSKVIDASFLKGKQSAEEEAREKEKVAEGAASIAAANAKSAAEKLVVEFGKKCVVKPLNEGSSLGVFIVEGARDLQKIIEQEVKKYGSILVEQFVEGRELTVSVLGTGKLENLRALPVIEIAPNAEFYDFEAKYAQGGSRHICPAHLTEEQTLTIQKRAREAHFALGCDGVSRSDFILDSAGEFWILETNTIPGMTSTSLLPEAARVAGISFPELCVQLVEMALEK